MFKDRERDLFHANQAGCPAHEPGKCGATKGGMGKCDTPDDCPILFWLQATGLLKLGVYPLALPKAPPDEIGPSTSAENHNNKLNGAGK